MTRTLRRFAVVLIVALALFGIFATAAMAALEDTPTPPGATSATNPGWGADTWWRDGWGNSLYPDFELMPPSVWNVEGSPNNVPPIPADGYLLGSIYTVDRSFGSVINTATPQNYYRDAFPVAASGTSNGGTNLDNTIDLLGIYQNPPSGSWPAQAPNTSSPLEGQWYLHYCFYSNFRYQGGQWDIPFGVDLTPPTAVTGLRVASGLTAGAYDPSTWVPTKRGYITWDAGQYDKLSGVGYYKVLIDDQPILPDTAAMPSEGRVYSAPWLPTPNSITIENLASGRHKLSVVAVDRATNESPETSVYYQSDPDTPTVSWLSPTGSALVPAAHTISVDASDQAGDPVVTLSLGGSGLATMTAPPYSVTPDFSSLATGTYALTATVTDHFNRKVTITKNVTWSPGGIAGSTSDPSVDVTSTPGTSPDSADPSTGGSTGWTNNLSPSVLAPPPPGATDIFYNVVQTRSPLDPINLQDYFHSNWSDRLHVGGTVSLKDSIDNAPTGGWIPGPTGSVAPYEGTWYYQWVWYNRNTQGVSPNTYTLKFNVDLTPPAMVSGFTATPAGGGWTSSTRAHLTWSAHEYDALSGDDHYEIYLDGAPAISVNATSVMSGSATIEDMPAGAHTIEIAAVDKAGNVGQKAKIVFKSDPDVPKIAFIEPTSTITPRRHVITVDASDAAGDPQVQLLISGGTFGPTPLLIATLNSPPYTITPDFAGVPSGAYQLYATVTDQLNRKVTINEPIFWDATEALVTDSAVDLADGAHIGTSSSNPGALDSIDTWWRQGWGKSLTPDFELTPPNPAVDTYGFLVGTLYNITTTPSDINIASPDSYYRAARGTGTNLDQTIDLQGIFNYPPVGGWRAFPVQGANQPIEGPWYLDLVWFTSKGFTSTRTYHVPIGIDVTPPAQVESLTVSPTISSADATDVIGTSRVHISWKPKEYDALSGVAYYQVVIDGSTVIPDSAANPAQGRVYNIPGVAPSSVTIENLSPGAHEIGIEAVDRATNVGKLASKTIYCDPDTPTISFAAPGGSWIAVNANIAVNAADKGGVKSVKFKLDNTDLGTDTAAPYSLSSNLNGFANGAHVLSATVTDMFGRQVTLTKSVTLDKVPLSITSFSRNYSTFYPIRRDKYYDNLTITFYASKTCSAQVRITNSAGALVRGLSKTAVAGKNSVTWDGKWAHDNKAHTGTYYIQVTATDSSGNSTATGKLQTVIKNYQIVVSRGKAKVVPR